DYYCQSYDVSLSDVLF
nr:immunoglobulin light chain junction region [Macaca mulatta]MOV98558.1 immunoglobulin light chain junction region [Macaca mulatta]MOW01041.1 immunoglobulin light chain junction region [Macaca mulatta]MOW01083.1 immunoglobulin light chain junction region [Macaca mulatta]